MYSTQFDESCESSPLNDARKRTLQPTATGTSVLGIKFGHGVVLAADTLVSYGGLAKYPLFERLFKVNDNCVIAATGDIADFQYLKDVIEDECIQDRLLDDGFTHRASAIHSWITRVLYNRRSRMNPLWNTYIVGGLDGDAPFLGYTNLLGVSFKDDSLATGFGSYIALPYLRNAHEKRNHEFENLTEAEAIETIIGAMKLLYCRDCRAFNNYQLAIITKQGVTIKSNQKLDANWDISKYVCGYD